MAEHKACSPPKVSTSATSIPSPSPQKLAKSASTEREGQPSRPDLVSMGLQANFSGAEGIIRLFEDSRGGGVTGLSTDFQGRCCCARTWQPHRPNIFSFINHIFCVYSDFFRIKRWKEQWELLNDQWQSKLLINLFSFFSPSLTGGYSNAYYPPESQIPAPSYCISAMTPPGGRKARPPPNKRPRRSGKSLKIT